MAGLGLTMSFDPDEVQSALRKAGSFATASLTSRLLTRTYLQAVPMRNWERQAINWPNSEPLFSSIVRRENQGPIADG
jgi:hypothetical protein